MDYASVQGNVLALEESQLYRLARLCIVQPRMNSAVDELSVDHVRPSPALERLGLALSEPIRQMILLRLSRGPAYPSELADLVKTSRSNLSNHLACLRGCGLVVAERQGRRVRYELVTSRLGEALAMAEEAVDEASLVVGHGR